MDLEQFTEFKSGELLPITVAERLVNWAFVPRPLPVNWKPPDRLWRLIADARDQVGQLSAIGGILPNPALLLRPLQRREAIKSNSIEGTYVEPEELLLFEVNRVRQHEADSPRRDDWREVAAYDLALSEGCRQIKSGRPIDRTLICDLHRRLLQATRGREKQPGRFRDAQVYIEAARRYIPPPPDRVNACFANLEGFLASQAECDPLIRAFIAHYQFEAIHPFKDGNGRIGRLLLSLTIYKWLEHSAAWLYLSEYFEKHRSEYLRRLFAISANGEWDEWLEFCLRGTIEHAAAAIARCRKLNDLKRRYEDTIGHKSPRMNRILTKLFSNPFVTIVELAAEFDITHHTARREVERLIEARILAPTNRRRPQAFRAQEIFRIAYEE